MPDVASPRKPCNLFSPVKYRYFLAARCIKDRNVAISDIGGYKSREDHLVPHFDELKYESINVGSAWYDDEAHFTYDGVKLPWANRSRDHVISVDTIEHVDQQMRYDVVSEMVRCSKKSCVIVTPFTDGSRTYEEHVLDLCDKFSLQHPPSLVEHVHYGLPTLSEIQNWGANFGFEIEYATDKHTYWEFQIAMLINSWSIEGDAEPLNRQLQAKMEALFLDEKRYMQKEDSYRAILVLTDQ